MKRNKINQESYLNKGKIEYNFDFQKEKLFYSQLCFQKLNKKDRIKYQRYLKSVNEGKNKKEKYEFNNYLNWRKYIIEKYESYPLECLSNFSAYLNWGCRNIEIGNEWFKSLITSTISVLLAQLIAILSKNELPKITWYNFFLFLIVEVIFILIGTCIVYQFLNRTVKDSQSDKIIEFFYKDYKKIIDELIENKQEYYK